MLRKIERPDWYSHMDKWNNKIPLSIGQLDDWFTMYVEPLNKLIDGSVEIKCCDGDWITANSCSVETWNSDDWIKRAYLINITEIEKESAESLLRECVAEFKSYDEYHNLWNKISALLESSE
jgi:hypothetical protein